MSNVVIASKDALCQSAKKWFVDKKKFAEGLEKFSSLKDGESLIIIAHDKELGDSSGLIEELRKQDFPMTKFKVLLIVCSAASLDSVSGIVTPAEALANYFRRSVEASTTVVTGKWTDTFSTFEGSFITVYPHTDIISQFENLTI